ncbi:MAG TPA: transketolase, partial [Desulfurivibrionaceae bacterium]|nr:transketolase [Desulfurivibrionaceae bacterium]
MGAADIATVLFRDHLKFDAADPKWPDRDRFVLSAGHGSMLIYALMHLMGVPGATIDEIRNFRQLGFKTAGHPEYGHFPGVETTTGPLGQGIANAVGMAIAEKTLAGQFNRPGHAIIDHHTYVFMGDGCMMEGISHEAYSLAGTLKLGKLIVFYDDNGISIDGEVEGWFTDNTPARFRAYGWHVIEGVDGHDAEAVKKAAAEAKKVTDKPSLICCKTIIGFGSPNKQGKEVCHGAPLGDDEIALTRQALGWSHGPFEVPAEVYAGWDAKKKGAEREAAWNERLDAYRAAHPELAAELERRLSGKLPADWQEKAGAYVAAVNAKAEKVATRKASQNCLNGYGPLLPEFLGGSADLAGSNLTLWSGSKGIQNDAAGNYVFYGVREFGMAAIMNGVALHGGFIPYGATFLIFSEYARNAIRMSALMKAHTIEVLTHDSIGLGEDGPTHQPVEQIATLRMIPNCHTWRPCDGVETAVAWKAAVEKQDGPSCLALSRQNLPHMARTDEQLKNISRGGYILHDCGCKSPDAILIATGSEVELAMNAAKALADKGKKVRVVSMPCTNIFDAQDAAYREAVLPAAVTARVAVEAGVSDGWYKYVGLKGKVVGLDRFGESAPAEQLFSTFGFTVDNVVKAVEAAMA